MKKLLLLIIVSLMLAGVASANTVWSPAGNPVPIVPPATGNWAETLNWANGLPVSAGDGTLGNDSKAVFNLGPGTAWCIVDSTVEARTMSMSHDTVATGLRIVNGGTLELGLKATAGWHAIGYSGASRVDIERGGLMHLDDRCIFGADYDRPLDVTDERSQLNINGGTFRSNNGIQLHDWEDTRRSPGGDITLNGGLIDLQDRGLDWRGGYTGAPLAAEVNINFGTIIVNGDDTTQCQLAIDQGGLVAFGGAGTIIMDYNVRNSGKTTITADPDGDPLARTPTYDGFSAWNPTLSWVNLDPVSPATQVWVDVRFGTDNGVDPNGGAYYDFAKVLDKSLLTNVGVTTPDNGEYLWQVVTYQHGHPDLGQYNYGDDPNLVGHPVDEGILMAFYATDDFPPEVVIDTPPTATWKNVLIPLTATVNNDDTSPLNSIVWSSDEDPNATFSNELYSEIPDPCNVGYVIGTATADVTVNYDSGAFNVTLTVGDSNPSLLNASDTVGLDCRQDACAAARDGVGRADDYPADLVVDCEHELADFAVIASDWLADYALKVPTELP